jgi:hypothetical protein
MSSLPRRAFRVLMQACCALSAGCGGNQSALDPVGPGAARIDLWWLMLLLPGTAPPVTSPAIRPATALPRRRMPDGVDKSWAVEVRSGGEVYARRERGKVPALAGLIAATTLQSRRLGSPVGSTRLLPSVTSKPGGESARTGSPRVVSTKGAAASVAGGVSHPAALRRSERTSAARPAAVHSGRS